MDKRHINNQVRALFDEWGSETLPVNVIEIARCKGLEVLLQPLDDEISGMLIIQNHKGVIVYKEGESKVRQRFTIAHELGHYILHKNQRSLFWDKDFKVMLRSQVNPEQAELQVMEQEANAFAAAILMPEHLLKREIENNHFDLADENSLIALAKLFKVSTMAMTYRVANLRLI